MRAFSNRLRLAPLVGLLVAWPSLAMAQSGQTAQIPLQFDYLNPGARSLGLASAFIAVADDATAALTNPAGLTSLVKPEVSAELRYRSLDTRYLSGGRLSGTATNLGIDTVGNPTYGTSQDTAFRPYFVSVVYPKGRLSIAAYRHELVLQHNTFLSQGPFAADGFSNNVRFAGLSAERDITIDNLGASVGYRISDQLSVGIGVAAHRFHISSDFGSLGSTTGTFGPVDPSTLGQISTSTQAGSGTRATVNGGVLFRPHPRVRAGFVFRQGASFDYEQDSVAFGLPQSRQIGRFQTPMVIGGGVRIQPNDRWSFAVDVDRIQYSKLKSDFIDYQVPESQVNQVSVPDGTEVHVGGEYTLVGVKMTPSIRGGIWYDPKHAVEFSPAGTTTQDQLLDAAFPGGKSLVHYCVGVGLPLSPALEFNFGADVTSERRYVSASIVARFGK